jgi:ribosomal protein S18 acetylase RimI-like enzyme
MTPAEFEEWQTFAAEEYAAVQVQAGRWGPDEAVELARGETARLLPQGLDTPRMLFLRAIDTNGEPVGRAWIGLDHPRSVPDAAFLYDIEVLQSRRGQGLGRALLGAVEDAARLAGAEALELNVFGYNGAAIALYDSAGYEVTTQQMRKEL